MCTGKYFKHLQLTRFVTIRMSLYQIIYNNLQRFVTKYDCCTVNRLKQPTPHILFLDAKKIRVKVKHRYHTTAIDFCYLLIYSPFVPIYTKVLNCRIVYLLAENR